MSKKPGPKNGLNGEAAERVTYTLDAMTRRKLKVLGKDNESLGVREAARIAYEVYQRTADAATAPSTRTDGRAAPLRVG